MLPSPVRITHRASSRGRVEASASRIAWSSAPRRSGLEMVRRETPGAGSSTSRRPPPAESLLEDNEWIALGHRLALLHADLLDHAGILGLHRHLHLHRLEDHDSVALLDLIADGDLDLPHGSGDVRLDDGQETAFLCSLVRGTISSG